MCSTAHLNWEEYLHCEQPLPWGYHRSPSCDGMHNVLLVTCSPTEEICEPVSAVSGRLPIHGPCCCCLGPFIDAQKVHIGSSSWSCCLPLCRLAGRLLGAGRGPLLCGGCLKTTQQVC